MSRLIEFSGHFHPVLVHLPIGFLLLALVFQWLVTKEKYAQIKAAVRISFLLGMISAVLSCITGLCLSSGGEYDVDNLFFHQWCGIAVAVLSGVCYWLSAKPVSATQRIISTLLFLLIVITGHLGGTLTHGEGFLTKGWNGHADSGLAAAKPIANIPEALVFSDIIQPVLNNKCGSCHSAVKQKGGLRLDGKEWILKGGKDGLVFANGDPDKSELYKRIILDPLEEKHMPPKGKPQLNEREINLIHWWIGSQAGFDKKVKELEKEPQITAALLALQSAAPSKRSFIPITPVDAVSQSVLDTLRKAGIAVSPVAINSNYLQASFAGIPKPGNREAGLLKLVQKQLISLKMAGAKLSNESWQTVADCKLLYHLSIERSNINDTTIQILNKLQQLQYLNLVGTDVSVKGMQQLKGLSLLSSLYLGHTGVRADDLALIQKQFPSAHIDSGNYHVASLVTDTQLLKAPPVKK